MKPAKPISTEDALKGIPFESGRRTITDADIVNFCGVSGDYSVAHADDHAMRETPYGGVIAHGMLVMSVASALADIARPFPLDVSYGYEKVRFLSAVKPGDTIRVRQTVQGLRPYSKNPDKMLYDILYEVVTTHEKVVCACTHILLGPRIETSQVGKASWL
jgi:acyl dehydratase